jgi:hypothetical protein
MRLAPELRLQVEAICQQTGTTISDFIRAAIFEKLSNTGAIDVNGAYAAARSLVMPIVRAIFLEASHMIPATYEEAIQRFGVAAPLIAGFEDR